MKHLLVFNTCAPSRFNAPIWIENINKLKFDPKYNVDVVISDCCSSTENRKALLDSFPEYISFIDTQVSVFISFNSTVNRMEALRGEYDYAIYVDSGCFLNDDNKTLDHMFAVLEAYRPGMLQIPATNDNDDEYRKVDLNVDQDIGLLNRNQFLNLHCVAISSKIKRAYGQYMMDVINDCGLENFFWYLPNSIKLPFAYIPINRLALDHIKAIDGGGVLQTLDNFSKKFSPNEFRERLREAEDLGIYVGSPCDPFWGPASKIVYFDQPLAYNWVKNNLFLSKEDFDYNKIEGTLMERKDK
jgi:hypothetical protein